ncbi:MAG: helix-turn-helix domain-containing protein [Candidatus Brocadiia bacterium]
MRELGTSGVWARLSKAAKAVYPMLGIHTDGTFKPVYPSIPRLVELTGLSKKGVEDGLRDLEAKGLLVRRSGKSRRRGEPNRPNIYEFRFEYPGSTLGYLVGKPLASQQPSPLATHEPSACPPSSPEQESIEREQQQQQPIHLNITLQQDQRLAAAAVDLLRQYFDEQAARRFAEKYPPDYIREKVELVEQRSRRSRLHNKSGYLRRALEDGWSPGEGERDAGQFAQLVSAIRRGEVGEGIVAGVSWRAGITADGKAVYLTHMTSGAQMRLESWEDCAEIDWR